MIRIGTQGWSYKDWLGNFYPENSKPADYLSTYSKKYSTVEIDSTFYAIPRRTTVEKWYRVTPADFKFAAKFPKQITHESDLTGVNDIVLAFLNTVSSLKNKLGPLLIQFPYSFKPDMSSNLFKFLDTLPDGFNFVVELRNRKWLEDKFFDNLHKRNIGLAILDHPWMPKINKVTSNIVYTRFLGDRKKITNDFTHEHVDRSEDLQKWREFLIPLFEQTGDFYGFFNNHYSGHSPTTADKFIELLK
jgi:uncharacterized protein YecE (DUF72 family)